MTDVRLTLEHVRDYLEQLKKSGEGDFNKTRRLLEEVKSTLENLSK